MSNRLFSDKEFDRQLVSTEKTIKRAFGVIFTLWVLGVLLSLGVTGVIIWAIVKMVIHFTA